MTVKMNLFLLLILPLLIFISGCGDSSESARRQLKEKISLEDFCRLQKEIVDIGMMNYYDLIKNKKPGDVIKEMENYRREIDGVLKKNNMDLKTLLTYKRVLNKEIDKYLAANPEMNWNATPEQIEFNTLFARFLKRSLGLQ